MYAAPGVVLISAVLGGIGATSGQALTGLVRSGGQEIGKFDPKTTTLTEFSIPIAKPGWPLGKLGLRADRQGNLWFGVGFQATVAKFDPPFSAPYDVTLDKQGYAWTGSISSSKLKVEPLDE